MKEIPTDRDFLKAYLGIVNTQMDGPIKEYAEHALKGIAETFGRYLKDTGTIYHYEKGKGILIDKNFDK